MTNSKDCIIAKAVPAWVLLTACLLDVGPTQAGVSACTAASGVMRVALVELFTSEGCSSCPPADRWLSALRSDASKTMAPLAFHVGYWDRLGWRDRFAQPVFVDRQYALARQQKSDLVYTPQFFRDGIDWRPLRAGSATPKASTPGADLQLELETSTDQRLAVGGEVRLRQGGNKAELYLALYENNLSSRIEAGENAGSLLHHDYVVRALRGPLPLAAGGAMTIKQGFDLDPAWKRADLGVTAFVQDAATRRVLQALQLPLCRD